MRQLSVVFSGLLVILLVGLLVVWNLVNKSSGVNQTQVELKESSVSMLIPTVNLPLKIEFRLTHPELRLKASGTNEVETKFSQALATNTLVNSIEKTFIGKNIPVFNPNNENVSEVTSIVIDYQPLDQISQNETILQTYMFDGQILHQITAGRLENGVLEIPVFVDFNQLEGVDKNRIYLSSLAVLAIEFNALETVPTHQTTTDLSGRFIDLNNLAQAWFELEAGTESKNFWENIWSKVVVQVGAQSCSPASVNCRRTITEGTCVAGIFIGQSCSSNSDCGGPTCAITRTVCASLGTGGCVYNGTYNACFPSCDASPLAPDPCNASLSCSLVTGGGGGGGGGTTTWCGDGFCNGVETSITCPTDCPPGSSGGGSSGGGGSTASCPWCTGADQCPAGWDWEANHPACGGLGCCTGGGGGGTTWTPNCDWDLSGPEYPQCKYGEGNSCSPLCISLGGCSGCADGLVGSPCVCPTPTVTSSLSANPTSGEAPLNGVDLIARVTGGTATGSIRYRFACTSSGGYLREFNTTNLTVTATDLCNYPSSGTYTARVEVNRQGIVNTSYVNITVSEPPANVAPTVTITLPSNGASFVKGDDISIAANASDADGSIVSVQLYVDGSSLGPDFAAPPYTYNWTNVQSVGNHVITARAIDNRGAWGYSAPVTITVEDLFSIGGTGVLNDVDGLSESTGDRCEIIGGGVTLTGVQPGLGARIDLLQGGSVVDTSGVNLDGSFAPFNASPGTYRAVLAGLDGDWTCWCPEDCTQSVSVGPDDNSLTWYVTDKMSGWFQIWGGDVHANKPPSDPEDPTDLVIVDPIPFTCVETDGCKPYLSLLDEAGTIDSSGMLSLATGTYDLGVRSGNQHEGIDEEGVERLAETYTGKRQDFDYFLRLYEFPLNPVSDFMSEEVGSKPTSLPVNGVNAYFQGEGKNLIIDNSWGVGAGEELVVFVEGDLVIRGAGTRVQVAEDGFLAFIVGGDIIIEPEVGVTESETEGVVEGVYVANGSVNVESNGSNDLRFVGEGSFVGWGGVFLKRDFGDNRNNTAPVEIVKFRPDLVINAPEEMMRSKVLWQEVAP